MSLHNNGYNGWSNRETWLVNVWFNPESRTDVELAREALEEQYNSMPDGPLKDMVSLSEVDWDELLDHFEEDEDQDEDYLDSDAHLEQVE